MTEAEEVLGWPNTRFICPDCGSNRWGTSNLNKPMDEWVGHCHGHKCNFTWNRKDDDSVFMQEHDSGAKP